MSFANPRRVAELSPLVENDDSGFRTPLRSSFTDSTTKKSFFPKRISELSPLESSDDEESLQNKAFLDDSFIETSPEKGENDVEVENNVNTLNTPAIHSARKLSVINESNESGGSNNSGNGKRDSASSRQLLFDNMPIPGDNARNVEKDRPQISIFQKIQSNNSGRNTGPFAKANLVDDKSLDASSLNGAMESLSIKNPETVGTAKPRPFEERAKSGYRLNQTNEKLCSELSTPKVSTKPLQEPLGQATVDGVKKINSTMENVESKVDETPYKDFQMPAPTTLRRLQSSTQRSLVPSSHTKSSIANEFRSSQKVLFTTPSSSVSRPTLQMRNNLNILDDSLQCYKSSPFANMPKEEPITSSMSNCETKTITSNHILRPADNIDGKIESKPNIHPKNEMENDQREEKDEKKILRINGKDFVIQKQIGSGGSSSVYLAEHKDTKMECALKMVDLRGDPALVEGYIKEVKILAMLQDKVNVIRLYEYALIKSENVLYMVMEKGDSDLRKILQSYKTSLPLYTLMTYWHQMLQSVAYIHKNDVIHSDLKPENFLMVRGRLKLIDFGISSKMAVDATSIIKYSQVGTFNYISPETLMDTSTGNSPMAKKNQPKIKISTKSDVWSLGCILYLLLYKRTPFAHIKNVYAKMQAIINPNVEVQYEELPNYYPPMLLEMVKLCLKHNPKERSSVAELLNFPFDMVIPLNT